MWIPTHGEQFKSLQEREVTARVPEAADLYQQILEAKKKSRIMIRADEIQWRDGANGEKHGNLIDFRLGFENSLCNLAISEIPCGAQASEGHTHGEAYIYWLEGSGTSIVGEQRVEWSAGDAMYVPPDTFHQHFVNSDTPVKYLRIIPSPLLLNLLAVMASVMPYLKPEAQK